MQSHKHQGQTHHQSSWQSPTPHCFCGIPLFGLWDPSLHRAPCPAPHQPCLAWRQAALSQFSAPETSGISLGVPQNAPKAPLISSSCCTPAQQGAGGSTRSISRPSPRRWQGHRWHSTGGTAPGAGEFLIPGEAPTFAENKAHFVTLK